MDTITLKLNGKPYQVDADPRRFTVAELNAVERNTGMTVREWTERLQDRGGSTLAWTALAWIAKRRAGEFVKWHELEEDLHVLELIESVEFGTTAEPEADATA